MSQGTFGQSDGLAVDAVLQPAISPWVPCRHFGNPDITSIPVWIGWPSPADFGLRSKKPREKQPASSGLFLPVLQIAGRLQIVPLALLTGESLPTPLDGEVQAMGIVPT